MTLRAELCLRRSSFELSLSLQVADGGVLAVLGPNGSGKSTLLACLAGLLQPDSATVTLAGRTLDDATTHLPPHRRGVGLLAQEPMLFPHLSVLDNVAFAPRAAGRPRHEAAERAHRWLAEVDATALAARRPSALSGGQAQRVALARALAATPDLLLLDEPLAALDVDAAPAVRGLLRRVLHEHGRQRTTLLVTHDPLDALTLADHVAVLTDGAIVERGPTREVLAAPRTAFAARLAGLNLVPGQVRGGVLCTADGMRVAGVPAADLVGDTEGVAVFAPGSVAVFPEGTAPTGSPRTVLDTVVTAVEPRGALVRVRTACGVSAEITPAAVADLALEPGVRVRLAVKAASVTLHPAAQAIG